MRLAFLLFLSYVCYAEIITELNEVLVLIDHFYIKDSHSSFLDSLSSANLFLTITLDSGYHLTIKSADDPSLDLKNFEFGGRLNVDVLVNFIDDGGNIVVVANSNIGEAVRELGSKCGVEFDEEKTFVIDHFNNDSEDYTHTKLIVPVGNLIKVPVITGGQIKSPLLYRGIGVSTNSDNPLLIDILHGSRTSYSYNPRKKITDYPNTVGTNTQLIAALQARNNARVLFIGSLDFLSNQYFESKVRNTNNELVLSGNKELAHNLMRWVFGETGQLRCVYVKHNRVGELEPPNQYTIMDDIVYVIKIETKVDGKWVTYEANDVQLEFIRIDPFIRKTLKFQDDQYKLVTKLPDVYGVFKFVVNYHRLGYTHLFNAVQIPVRPFTHTQYERFIPSAYPYYASALSMMGALVMFSFIFLYFKDDKEKSE